MDEAGRGLYRAFIAAAGSELQLSLRPCRGTPRHARQRAFCEAAARRLRGQRQRGQRG